jgi:hypothetical protein
MTKVFSQMKGKKMLTVCLVLLSAPITAATLIAGPKGLLVAFSAEALIAFAFTFCWVCWHSVKEEAHLGGLLK